MLVLIKTISWQCAQCQAVPWGHRNMKLFVECVIMPTDSEN